ncbi:S8 family serine peptidase [Aestuariibaculum sediminum]|uniref:S8 family serine peptidase n=1 Tax=Aestuariibaculum sediminum TaxID=2770637 RepID=A0A8J6Q7M3_9FLAO|nr:S8 family serine peptidase [Aestuariibaculum sediminum]MBD0832683.1 S8 family serine peptidase [Aestuariibaculum sediminum]
MKNVLLCCILIGIRLSLFAQQDAWVYFKDKGNTYNINTPTNFLSQKAIDRKAQHGVAIDERDIPVNESYISTLKGAVGITVMAKSKWFNAVHVRGSQTDITNLVDAVNYPFVDYVDFADKNLNSSKVTVQKTKKKEAYLATTFNYGSAANQATMIHANELHLANFTGTGMTVAVMDAGFPGVNTIGGFQRLRDASGIIDTYDFVDREIDVYNNTTDKHGTWVLSTMAGYIENQFVGTAPDASYYLFITEDGSGENPVEESYWVEAAERADSLGVDVINTSLGYGAFYTNLNYRYSAAEYDGQTTYITKGANIAFEKGLLLINSVGNEGENGVNAPADSPYVLSIGAVDASGTYASFSSVGSPVQPSRKPDVVAQGQASYVIDVSNAIGTINGTSFSSPILAGGITCLWQALPNKTNAEIMKLVRESASQYNTPDYELGYGIPDLYASLNQGLSVQSNRLDLIKVFPNPTRNTLYLQLPNAQISYLASIYDVLGKQVNNTKISSHQNKIELASLAKGLYVLRLKSPENTVSIKLIKQ